MAILVIAPEKCVVHTIGGERRCNRQIAARQPFGDAKKVRSAATRAPHLFSAHEVEIELNGSSRLVRGSVEDVSYDGPVESAPPTRRWSLRAPLHGHGDHVDIGELRLRFRRPVKLSEREQYKLRTFASALCTAIRNATAYAELDRLAAEHAHAAAHDALTGLANRRQLLDQRQPASSPAGTPTASPRCC